MQTNHTNPRFLGFVYLWTNAPLSLFSVRSYDIVSTEFCQRQALGGPGGVSEAFETSLGLISTLFRSKFSNKTVEHLVTF